MGSFLIIAAAATFIGAAVPSLVRLAGLGIITALFYFVGMILYKKLPHLKPAATAFIGTSLAIIPFNGIALNMLGNMSVATSWLLVSAIGLIAYIFATMFLQSGVVSYLSMAFVLSLASSVVMSANLEIVWYFIALISISLIANLISLKNPKFLPEIFSKSIETTGQMVTPISLIASLFVLNNASPHMYEILLGLSTLHYLLAWFQTKNIWYETFTRTLAHATILTLGWDLSKNFEILGIWSLVTSILQFAYSFIRVKFTNKQLIEKIWFASTLGIIGIGNILFFWNNPNLITTSLAVMGVLAVIVSWKLKNINWSCVTLAVSGVLPFVVGRWLIVPNLSWLYILHIFAVVSVILVIFHWINQNKLNSATKLFLSISFALHSLLTITTGVFGLDTFTSGYAFGIVALLLVLFSYSYKIVLAEPIGAVFAGISMAILFTECNLNDWYYFAVVISLFSLIFVGTALHHFFGEIKKRNNLIVFSQIVLCLLSVNNKYLLGNNLIAQFSFWILLASAIVSIIIRTTNFGKSFLVSKMPIFTISNYVYLVLAWVGCMGLSLPHSIAFYAVASVLFWSISYIQNKPIVTILGNLSTLGLVGSLWNFCKFDSNWFMFSINIITAVILYLAYWLMTKKQDSLRRLICLASVWCLTGIAVISQFNSNMWASALSIISAATTIAVHGKIIKNKMLMELSIYAGMLGIQLLVADQYPHLNMVLYTHLWAAIMLLVNWLFYKSNDKQKFIRLLIGASFVTASVAKMALFNEEFYQIIFLVEQLGILAYGSLLRKKWAIWWGTISSTAAVLYFLRSYTYLWLSFLGIILIAIVVWRLSKISKK